MRKLKNFFDDDLREKLDKYYIKIDAFKNKINIYKNTMFVIK